MQQYTVLGMSCAACSARVQKAVEELENVTSCNVNLLTNSMIVDGNVSPEEIIKAVQKAGYDASIKAETPTADMNQDSTTTPLLARLISSAVLTALLMVVSMGHMWGIPIPKFLDNPLILASIQLVLSFCVLIINRVFFINGVKGVLNKAPNMDTLVSLGSGVSFLYSVAILFSILKQTVNGDLSAATSSLHGLYFESAAMILTLITLGKLLEAHAKGKTTNALKDLMALSPKTAIVIRDNKEHTIPIEQLKVDDVFAVPPGSSIATDGVVIEGVSSIDESSLTGESLPVDKISGDNVYAGTINHDGYILCRATKVGKDTTLSAIIKMVSDATATKAPIAKLADKVSGVFVPGVVIISIITIIAWLIAGAQFPFALSRMIAVLVISCPCALGLATPVAIMVASGVGAKNGLLFKTAESLEKVGKTKVVAFDKTGTITKGTPAVSNIFTAENISEKDLLSLAFCLENKSEHPLAKAIVEKVSAQEYNELKITDFTAVVGGGVTAILNGETVFGGNRILAEKYTHIPKEMLKTSEDLAKSGNTSLWFGKGNQLYGLITVADQIKKDSADAISQLKALGIESVMLTGDTKGVAQAIAEKVKIDTVVAEILPLQKQQQIEKLKQKGVCLMVGDGINDAPALTSADIGVAIGAGTHIAVDSAQVVLVNNKLTDVPAAIRLSRATLKNITENLFWAFFYNVLGIPLAAGLFIPFGGFELPPMFGAFAMSLSSFCVVMNALRLNFLNPHSSKKDKPLKIKHRKEEKTMKKTLIIKGMMCPHCEARVKSLLEELPQVTGAEVSHVSGTAIVSLKLPISDEDLTKIITDAGYEVESIK